MIDFVINILIITNKLIFFNLFILFLKIDFKFSNHPMKHWSIKNKKVDIKIFTLDLQWRIWWKSSIQDKSFETTSFNSQAIKEEMNQTIEMQPSGQSNVRPNVHVDVWLMHGQIFYRSNFWCTTTNFSTFGQGSERLVDCLVPQIFLLIEFYKYHLTLYSLQHS